MTLRITLCCALALSLTTRSGAQEEGASRFERAADAATTVADAAAGAAANAAAASPQATVARSVAGAVAGNDSETFLPRDHGQIWRKYDISAYTSRVTTSKTPEQAVVDWILRVTGTDIWFTEPFGLLSANKNTLTVYHTPEVQEYVADVVDRFVSSKAESHLLSLRLVTIGSPNWRSATWHMMRPFPVEAEGVHGWLMSKENAAMVIKQLSKRTDFRDHSSPDLIIHNGQAHPIVSLRPKNYVKAVRLRQGSFAGHELEMGQLQEGYKLELSPLVSLDGRTIEAVIKCDITQVEKLVPVPMEIPTLPGQSQRVEVQVPQIVSWRLHERFRWPADQVLLLSCGVVAAPAQERSGLLGINGLPKLPFRSTPARADALLFIESRGKASKALIAPQRTADRPATNYRGRY